MSSKILDFNEESKEIGESFEYNGCVKVDVTLLDQCLKRKE